MSTSQVSCFGSRPPTSELTFSGFHPTCTAWVPSLPGTTHEAGRSTDLINSEISGQVKNPHLSQIRNYDSWRGVMVQGIMGEVPGAKHVPICFGKKSPAQEFGIHLPICHSHPVCKYFDGTRRIGTHFSALWESAVFL